MEKLNQLRSGQATSGPRTLVGEELSDALDEQTIWVYFMLMGLAIENLLKGILMAQHPEYLHQKTRLSNLVKTHDLLRLCNACGLATTPSESDLLSMLTEYVVWRGKYPVPLEIADMPPRRRGTEGTSTGSGIPYLGRKTREEMDSIYTRLWTELMRYRNAK